MSVFRQVSYTGVCVEFFPPLEIALGSESYCSSWEIKLVYPWTFHTSPSTTDGEGCTSWSKSCGTGKHALVTLQAIDPKTGKPTGQYLSCRPHSDGEASELTTLHSSKGSLNCQWLLHRGLSSGGQVQLSNLMQHSLAGRLGGVGEGEYFIHHSTRLVGGLRGSSGAGTSPLPEEVSFRMSFLYLPVLTLQCEMSDEGLPPGPSPQVGSSTPISQSDLADASQMCGSLAIRFAPQQREAEVSSDADSAPGGCFPDPRPLLHMLQANCAELNQFTKITLKTSTGFVKTAFNPPAFAPVVIPPWLARCPSTSINSSSSSSSGSDTDEDDDSEAEVFDAVERYEAQLAALSKGILEVLLDGYDDPSVRGGGGNLLPKTFSLFRAVCYPAAKNRPKQLQDAARAPAPLETHQDKTWITLLAATTFEGLELLDCDGASFYKARLPPWVEEEEEASAATTIDPPLFPSALLPRPGLLVMNVGDATEIASEGQYFSRPHRARNMDRNSHGTSLARVSLPYFVEPDPEHWPRIRDRDHQQRGGRDEVVGVPDQFAADCGTDALVMEI